MCSGWVDRTPGGGGVVNILRPFWNGAILWKLTIFYLGLANHRNASWICCRCANYSLIPTSIAFPLELSGPRLQRTHPISVPILSSNIHDVSFLPSLVYIFIDSLSCFLHTIRFCAQHGTMLVVRLCIEQTLAPY